MRRSFHLSPAMGIALVALFVVLGGSAFALGKRTVPVVRCGNGSVKAFAAIDFNGLSGALPSGFTSDAKFFAARYDCAGGSPQLRARPGNQYDIRFPGIRSDSAIVSVLSTSPGTASLHVADDGTYQIQVLDPSGNPSERGFTIVVF
jgi:hypothetical protein